MEHTFTANIKSILDNKFGKDANDIFEKSLILKYINVKTRSANKGSKSRSSFANLYAIYVLVEDYISKSFHQKSGYKDYEGAMHSTLLERAKTLKFGDKLQNHALDNRLNDEFRKKISKSELVPIIHNSETKRLHINENLLQISVGNRTFNLAESIIEIIDEYSRAKQSALQLFLKTCKEMQKIESSKSEQVIQFISSLLAKEVDARLFEIVSYSILKFYYHDQHIFWGYEIDNLTKDNLKLFKTGRTNANDGGIDFVMQPLGRFFQVTETLDFKKYFLDIDKIQKFPITFVIKSNDTTEVILSNIKAKANKIYLVTAIVEKYMTCIEEVINIPILKERFSHSIKLGYLNNILNEIVTQSKVEFNYSETEESDEVEEIFEAD